MDDKTLGFDEEMMEETEKTENLVDFKKPKRRPFVVWQIGNEDYKLKLTASVITKLEQRFKRNLLLYLTEDGIPAVADMLTTIQAALQQYHHGMTFLKVQAMYDQYVDEGGDQNKLLAEVLMPLLAVSGFFTQSQAETLTEELKNLDTDI